MITPRRGALLVRATVGVAVAVAVAVALAVLATFVLTLDDPPSSAARTAPEQVVTVTVAAPGPRAAPQATSTPLPSPRASTSLPPPPVSPAAARAVGGALVGKVVVVDPGHHGVDDARANSRLVPDGRGGRKPCNTSGTSTGGGDPEHAHNWAVATEFARLLRAQGAEVVLTRSEDRGPSPCVDERAAIGNRAEADLLVSIHADGAAASASGFHVIRSTRMAGGPAVTRRSALLADVVRDAYAQTTGRPRSSYLGGGTGITPRQDIAGLNLSRVPGVMLEAGNMRNSAEARLLSSQAFHATQARALATAVVRFLT